jgi:hypothetical protein
MQNKTMSCVAVAMLFAVVMQVSAIEWAGTHWVDLSAEKLIRNCFSMVHQQSPSYTNIMPERASFQGD